VQRAPVVRGYHGTSATQAAAILRDGFLPSDNDYDCLGNGVYFFEEGLAPARAWAKRAHPREPAVIRADIRLEDCMDLKDSMGWVPVLAQAHDEVLRISREEGLPLPQQTSGAHRLDRVVIEFTVAILEREGIPVRCVRGVFAEGEPAFPGSFLSEGSHVQVAVRDRELIRDVNLVPADVPDPGTRPVVDAQAAGERLRRHVRLRR
jgi:hypothetical protein